MNATPLVFTLYLLALVLALAGSGIAAVAAYLRRRSVPAAVLAGGSAFVGLMTWAAAMLPPVLPN
jgi:hypothetical protein